jgi:hypothetical protein
MKLIRLVGKIYRDLLLIDRWALDHKISIILNDPDMSIDKYKEVSKMEKKIHRITKTIKLINKLRGYHV